MVLCLFFLNKKMLFNTLRSNKCNKNGTSKRHAGRKCMDYRVDQQLSDNPNKISVLLINKTSETLISILGVQAETQSGNDLRFSHRGTGPSWPNKISSDTCHLSRHGELSFNCICTWIVHSSRLVIWNLVLFLIILQAKTSDIAKLH